MMPPQSFRRFRATAPRDRLFPDALMNDRAIAYYDESAITQFLKTLCLTTLYGSKP